MFNEQDWVKIGSYEAMGQYCVGVRIHAVAEIGVLQTERVHHAVYQANNLIRDAIGESQIEADPKAQELAVSERADLLGVFGGEAIYVEEIPNGYCHQYCCKHLPWFVVTTRIGRFVIGWRKRVISLDWSQCPNTKTAEELFPEEKVTKDGRSIHAWSLDDARRYVTVILAEGTVTK